MKETYYKFTAYNTEARYGYGTEAEADKYCDHLNRKREINVYRVEVVETGDLDAVKERDDIIPLESELEHIKSQTE